MKLTQSRLRKLILQEIKATLRENTGKQRGASQAELDQRNAEMDKIYDAYDAVFPAIQELEEAMKRVARVDTGAGGDGEAIYQMWMELRDRVQSNTSEGTPEEYDDGWSDWPGGETD